MITPKKKSSHKSEPPIDPLPEFVGELHSSFARLIEDARGFRGDLTIEAEFGRVLILGINNAHIAEKEQKDHSVSLDNFKCLLNPRSEHKGDVLPHTSFTNKLTSVPAEIDGLVGVQHTFEANSLWEEQQSGWSISYSLTYLDMETNKHFSINFDAESFVARLKLHKSFGSLYIHGTKRAWDYQITAHGAEKDEKAEERYAPLISKLQQAFYIPAGNAEPQLDFHLDQATHEKFSLYPIHVYKTSKHMSKDRKSILKLTEVLELDTHWKSIEDKGIVVWRARYSKVQGPKISNRWFTAAIESVQAKEFLHQNENLELGDEAGWTPYSFEQAKVVESLMLPACEMLKHMDGIGYHNSNGIARLAPAPTPSASTAPSKPYYFW
ncbi:hypothetical protein BJ875DRAFT_376675 [Amylocarpus encephaloides]|uniref:Uncharacterized protein n=1 Tax=Amylocarpus encephaloides TaxID=45428 RepID=A0A9P7YIW6_9HELO|nr:hypothetical protein BJ875DRAFT_376675 [Amylocarpus encephaloides]